MLRQQTEKADGQPNYSLADFVAPVGTGLADYIGGFAVTAGIGLDELCARFERDHDDYNSIMAKALADRLAEAYAEFLHKQARDDWGYGREEGLTSEDLIRERYRGIRPAPGYPASPDHTEKRLIFDLLELRRGLDSTDGEFRDASASSVSGLYFAHPAAKYFAVGKIGATRLRTIREEGMSLEEIERWLSRISRTTRLKSERPSPQSVLVKGLVGGSSWARPFEAKSAHEPPLQPPPADRPSTQLVWLIPERVILLP
jgi:5-methyltetrahydrofolate--homocysteine methyltransferase